MAAGSRLRDSKDAAYVGATLKAHVSCRPPQGHGLADQHHSTYVPATMLGALLQVGCPRVNNDKGKLALMGTARPKAADCTSPAIGARRKARIVFVSSGMQGCMSGNPEGLQGLNAATHLGEASLDYIFLLAHVVLRTLMWPSNVRLSGQPICETFYTHISRDVETYIIDP